MIETYLEQKRKLILKYHLLLFPSIVLKMVKKKIKRVNAMHSVCKVTRAKKWELLRLGEGMHSPCTFGFNFIHLIALIYFNLSLHHPNFFHTYMTI